jgi:ABC-type Fe3+/spermidine/putrescine transport system ATPase subunit
MKGNILEVNGLKKRYGDFEAVAGIDLAVEEGSLFAFLGQNGAGKSTTINTILGLVRPDGGSIRYDDPANFKSQIGVVFQDNVFDDLLTVEENLLIYGQLTLQSARAVKSVAARSWKCWVWGNTRKNVSSPCPAARSASLRSPARFSIPRGSCFSTSPRPALTRRPEQKSGSFWPAFKGNRA